MADYFDIRLNTTCVNKKDFPIFSSGFFMVQWKSALEICLETFPYANACPEKMENVKG